MSANEKATTDDADAHRGHDDESSLRYGTLPVLARAVSHALYWLAAGPEDAIARRTTVSMLRSLHEAADGSRCTGFADLAGAWIGAYPWPAIRLEGAPGEHVQETPCDPGSLADWVERGKGTAADFARLSGRYLAWGDERQDREERARRDGHSLCRAS